MAWRGARLVLCLLVAAASSGCLILPTWIPALRGRVVDRESGAPVAGVLVYAEYPVFPSFSHGSSSRSGGSAITSSDGEFFIEGRPAAELIMLFYIREFLPDITVCDPVYGWIGDQRDWTHGSTVQVSPTPGPDPRTRDSDWGCSEFRAEARKFAPKPEKGGR